MNFFREARWYEFWLPGSGMIGGLIFGALIWGFALIYLWTCIT